jgi:hypothetical protein
MLPVMSMVQIYQNRADGATYFRRSLAWQGRFPCKDNLTWFMKLGTSAYAFKQGRRNTRVCRIKVYSDASTCEPGGISALAETKYELLGGKAI